MKPIGAVALLSLAYGSTVNAASFDFDFDEGVVNLSTHYEYDPSSSELERHKEAYSKASQILCDATEGQLRIGRVTLNRSDSFRDTADVLALSSQGRSKSNIPSDWNRWSSDVPQPSSGLHVTLYRNAQDSGSTIAHEVSHLIFGLFDSYKEELTACGKGPSFDYPKLCADSTTNVINSSIPSCNDDSDCSSNEYCGNFYKPEMPYNEERMNSLMQDSSASYCFDSSANVDFSTTCGIDSDCATGSTCEQVRSSEFSVASNHDLLIGNAINQIRATESITNEYGVLPRNASISTFIGDTQTDAEASSTYFNKVKFVDGLGNLSDLNFYFTLLANDIANQQQSWQLNIMADSSVTNNATGDALDPLGQYTLVFNNSTDLSLVSLNNANGSGDNNFTVTNLSSNAANLTIDLFFSRLSLSDSAAGDVALLQRRGRLICNSPAQVIWDDPETTIQHEDRNGNVMDNISWMYNSTTDQFEMAVHSMVYMEDSTVNPPVFESEWETITRRYPFTQPAGLPIADAPASCNVAPTIVENLSETDQVFLVVDHSGSMNDCADQSESSCKSRLDVAKESIELYVDLQKDEQIDLGLISFNDKANPIQDLALLTNGTSGGTDAEAYITSANTLVATGPTAIGDALQLAREKFNAPENSGKSQTVYLLSDGKSNRGALEPEEVIPLLKDDGIIVTAIPTGDAVSNQPVFDLAAATHGDVLSAPDSRDLLGIYAELAANTRGVDLLFPRKKITLAPEGRKSKDVPYSLNQSMLIEEGSEELVVVMARRNTIADSWGINFNLIDPNGVLYKHSSPEVTVKPAYNLIQIPNPVAGTWILSAYPSVQAYQELTLVAFSDNPKPNLFIDALPHTVKSESPVIISANPVFYSDLESGFTLTGSVLRPDGSEVNIQLVQNIANQWAYPFEQFVGDGVYEVTINLTVDENALLQAGETLFAAPGIPARPDVKVEAFSRTATTRFLVQTGQLVACSGNDCDNDGLSNEQEGSNDYDGDGVPNSRDSDSDADGISDKIEQLFDRDLNGLPDAYDFQDEISPDDFYQTFPKNVEQVFFKGTANDWLSDSSMTLVGPNLWQIVITEDGTTNPRFKFDINGDWSVNYGDNNADGSLEQNGSDISLPGDGNYIISFNDLTLNYHVSKIDNTASAADWKRTVIYIQETTQAPEDMFIRGGIDHAYANSHLGRNCSKTNFECAVPIRFVNKQKQFSSDPKVLKEYSWQVGDTLLDWYGKEPNQGADAVGSPLAWTSNQALAGWNLPLYKDAGFGIDEENTFGAHYWKLEVEMDCSKTVNGWFEFKSHFDGWENDIAQSGTPYSSINHFAQCGKMNVVTRNSDSIQILPLSNSEEEESVEVNFSCNNGTTITGQNVYVVGNTAELGNWDPTNAVKLTPSAYPTWTGTIALDNPTNTVEWKCIKIAPDASVQWQGGSNNEFSSQQSSPISAIGSF